VAKATPLLFLSFFIFNFFFFLILFFLKILFYLYSATCQPHKLTRGELLKF
jgi:hypothetical protein